MGKVRFGLGVLGSHLMGSVAGVWKQARFDGSNRVGLYIADKEICIGMPGEEGWAKMMVWYAFRRWPWKKEYRGWDFVYFAAMQGKKGGVS